MTEVRQKVLTYAQDAGGARAILPVVSRLLREQTLLVQSVVHAKAVALFESEGIPASVFERLGYAVPLSEGDALHLLRRFAPNLLFCSTSHPRDPSNGRLLKAARKADIPTVAILDHWKGMERFREKSDGTPGYAPDLLGVMDQEAHAACVKVGLSREYVRVVGHPYLEELSCDRQWQDHHRVAMLKRKAGLDPAGMVVLLCSEIVHAHRYHDSCGPGCTPLSEVRIRGARLIDVVRQAVDRLVFKLNCPVELALRRHPAEDTGPHNGVLLLSHNVMSDVQAVALSTIVLGLSSMPLIEASVLGKPAASLAFFDGWNPTRVFFDSLTWAVQPFFTVLKRPEELSHFLADACSGYSRRGLPPEYAETLLRGSIDRCIELIKAGLSVSSQSRGRM